MYTHHHHLTSVFCIGMVEWLNRSWCRLGVTPSSIVYFWLGFYHFTDCALGIFYCITINSAFYMASAHLICMWHECAMCVALWFKDLNSFEVGASLLEYNNSPNILVLCCLFYSTQNFKISFQCFVSCVPGSSSCTTSLFFP